MFTTTNENLGPQGRLPPPLTGVGAKLQSKWLREVLIQGRSIRPYMNTRMPQFGVEHVEPIKEVIVATNSTLEGETTAQYISQLCDSAGITATALAHGVPLGGELEYVNANTIAHAFGRRRKL